LNNFFQPKIKIFLYLCEVREQGAGNREQGTGNREQGTGNSEQGTVSREQRAGSSLSKDCCLAFNYPIRSSGKYIKRGFNTPYNQKAKF